MFIYSLVVATNSIKDGIDWVASKLALWDDEMGSVFRIIEAGRLDEERVVVKVITNAARGVHACDNDLNRWMLERGAERGSLVWWSGLPLQ